MRIPDRAGAWRDRMFWVSVLVRGPMADGGGAWTLRQARSFAPDLVRPYYVLDRVLAERP